MCVVDIFSPAEASYAAGFARASNTLHTFQRLTSSAQLFGLNVFIAEVPPEIYHYKYAFDMVEGLNR
jgi:hypothetical protein